MKSIQILIVLFIFGSPMLAQFEYVIETGPNGNHIAHNWLDVQWPGGLFETSHWTESELEFWLDSDYLFGSQFLPTHFKIYDHDFQSYFESRKFRIDRIGLPAYRVNVEPSGITMNNAAGFPGVSMDGIEGSIELRSKIGQYGVSIESGSEDFEANVKVFNPINMDTLVWMYVYDKGINSYEGVIEADVKYFVMDHPDQPGQEIWYASIEGPEAAVYERGTAKLVNGEIFVPFSSHFKEVINPQGLTIKLTPLHWDTYGIAAIEKMTDGFLVKEMKGGKGNFAFDWQATSIRNGFEDYEVIREAKTHSPLQKQEIIKNDYPRKTKSLLLNSHEKCVAKKQDY